MAPSSQQSLFSYCDPPSSLSRRWGKPVRKDSRLIKTTWQIWWSFLFSSVSFHSCIRFQAFQYLWIDASDYKFAPLFVGKWCPRIGPFWRRKCKRRQSESLYRCPHKFDICTYYPISSTQTSSCLPSTLSSTPTSANSILPRGTYWKWKVELYSSTQGFSTIWK